MYITKIDQHGLTEVFATNSNGKPVCSADEKSHTPGKRDCRKKLRTRHDQQMQFCHSTQYHDITCQKTIQETTGNTFPSKHIV